MLTTQEEEDVRTVRAKHTDTTITVYQAYSAAIAERAVAAGTFVAPFKRERMTWIKPSFLWMMYRSGWGEKPDQERVLAVEMTRDGFEWALANASLSHYDAKLHADMDEWKQQKESSPVRVQWDPERSVDLERKSYRAIQIGLSGPAVHHYVDDWITGVADVTDLAHSIHADVKARRLDEAESKLPQETPYSLPESICRRIGAS
nr:DUF4291 domain-containing protein [Streptomyces albidus (ex Kaewkla and Franco 2022)]